MMSEEVLKVYEQMGTPTVEREALEEVQERLQDVIRMALQTCMAAHSLHLRLTMMLHSIECE